MRATWSRCCPSWALLSVHGANRLAPRRVAQAQLALETFCGLQRYVRPLVVRGHFAAAGLPLAIIGEVVAHGPAVVGPRGAHYDVVAEQDFTFDVFPQ